MRTPPLSPINTQTASGKQSPALSFRGHVRRRTSSFSSNHDRSPTTPRSKHRFSNASRYSAELRTPIESGHEDSFGGTGNLADELDQLDDEDEYDDEMLVDDLDTTQEVVRDSGIDVSYMESNGIEDLAKKQQQQQTERRTDSEEELPPGLEDAMDDLSRLCSTHKTDTEQTIPGFIRRLQDLGNQSAIESGVQRLNTSINSMSSHLDKETRSLQTLGASFLPPFGMLNMLDTMALDDAGPLIEDLATDMPMVDGKPSQTLQKLSTETDNVVKTLASLLDTLQMSKQTSNAASRHLRTTQTIVAELRRERERAEDARFALSKSDAEAKIQSKWAAQQCKDVVSGFHSVCESLQRDLNSALEVSA